MNTNHTPNTCDNLKFMASLRNSALFQILSEQCKGSHCNECNYFARFPPKALLNVLKSNINTNRTPNDSDNLNFMSSVKVHFVSNFVRTMHK